MKLVEQVFTYTKVYLKHACLLGMKRIGIILIENGPSLAPFPLKCWRYIFMCCFRLTSGKMDVLATLVWTLYIFSRVTVSAQGQAVFFLSTINSIYFISSKIHFAAVTIRFFVISFQCKSVQ